MAPAILPGDWLLVDPTIRRWPRRGTIVVVREPFTDVLAIKRVAARPGDWVPFTDGWLQMADDEAWLLGDADDGDLEAAGYGAANDSRRYGPVPVSALVGRAWFRYGPVRRIGRPAKAPRDLLARGRAGADALSPSRHPDSRSASVGAAPQAGGPKRGFRRVGLRRRGIPDAPRELRPVVRDAPRVGRGGARNRAPGPRLRPRDPGPERRNPRSRPAAPARPRLERRNPGPQTPAGS